MKQDTHDRPFQHICGDISLEGLKTGTNALCGSEARIVCLWLEILHEVNIIYVITDIVKCI